MAPSVISIIASDFSQAVVMSSLAEGHATPLLIIDGATVERLVSLETAIEVTEAALRKTSNGIANQDVRRTLRLPGAAGSCLSMMYASITDRACYGAKVLSVSPENFNFSLPSHQGGIMLFEREHGRPVALINGQAITGLRTPAASAVATRVLSRQNSSVLTVIGYGEQAARHIEAIALIRKISKVRVWGRDPDKAAAFARAQTEQGFTAQSFAIVQDAVADADIICTVTSSKDPVLNGAWITHGTHINAVGASVAGLRELDDECVVRSSVWVDFMPMAMTSASDLIDPISDGKIERSHILGEIGTVLNGDARGRQNDTEVTLYRSLGVPAQDIELANYVFEQARIFGLGAEVTL